MNEDYNEMKDLKEHLDHKKKNVWPRIKAAKNREKEMHDLAQGVFDVEVE